MYLSMDTQITEYQWCVKQSKDREKAPEAKCIEFPLTSLSDCAIQARLPEGEQRFVKRIAVKRVKPPQPLGR